MIKVLDTDILPLCKKAMGIRQAEYCWYDEKGYHYGNYNPMLDSHAMAALIAKFELNIGWETEKVIHVQPSGTEFDGQEELFTVTVLDGDLHRAVTLCVANMQKIRDEAGHGRD